MSRNLLKCLFGLLLTGLMSGAVYSASLLAEKINEDIIRVGLASSGLTNYLFTSVKVGGAGSGGLRIEDELNQPIWQGNGPVTLKRLKGQWQLWTTAAKAPLTSSIPVLTVKPVDPAKGFVSVPSLKRPGGLPYYRGKLDLTPHDPGRFYVINTLSMQDYLKAVVPNEMPARFGFEAIKAQSVAARNYALRPRETFWKTFDICDSQYCQAYYGAQTETPDTNRAIDETEGLVLLHNHQYVLTVFSSTAAGINEAYSHVFSDPVTRQFPAPALPYLQATPDRLVKQTLDADWDFSSESAARAFWTRTDIPSFDSASPYYRWTRQWTLPQLQNVVAHGLVNVSRNAATKEFVQPKLLSPDAFGALKSIRVTQRGRSGKAMALEVLTSAGRWTVQKEFLIRQILTSNGKLLPSGNVVLTEQRSPSGALTGLVAQGGGLGHGVGLSQYGAMGMAQQGYAFDDILRQYYPGSVLATRPIQLADGQTDKQLAFWGPKGLTEAASLWRQGGQVDVWLNRQPYKLDHQQDKPQCYPLPEDAVKAASENVIQVKSKTGMAARVWLAFKPCYQYKQLN